MGSDLTIPVSAIAFNDVPIYGFSFRPQPKIYVDPYF